MTLVSLRTPNCTCDKYGTQFELDHMEDSECEAESRMKKPDILALAVVSVINPRYIQVLSRLRLGGH